MCGSLRDFVGINDMLRCKNLTQRRKGRKKSLSWRSLRLGVSIKVVHHVSDPYRVCAIYKHFSGFEFFLLPSRIPVRPHTGNASR